MILVTGATIRSESIALLIDKPNFWRCLVVVNMFFRCVNRGGDEGKVMITISNMSEMLRSIVLGVY